MTTDPAQIVYVMGQLNFKVPEKNISAHAGRIKCWVPFEPITINLRFGSKTDCPYNPISEKERDWLNEQFEKLKLFNLSSNNPANTSTCLLSKRHIDYFKSVNPNNPNATIFIHGYNVQYGEYAGELLSANSNPKAKYDLFSTAEQVTYAPNQNSQPKPSANPNDFFIKFGDCKATIYRNRENIINKFGYLAKRLRLNNDKLNGDGSHNWWLHMEHNLNRAAGFNGFHYFYDPDQPQYTRIINIAWSGDPKSAVDYMAIEPVAAITAKAFISIIKQLKENHIKINIIAHSAGNIVLIKAMETLGKEKNYHECIENVFLWDAAIPDTALSPNANELDSSLNSYWQTKHAYLAAKKIHILFSYHDNILGPIPVKRDGKKTAKFTKKLLNKSSRGNALLALGIDVIDHITKDAGVPNGLQSAYHMAQLFGIPLSVLLNSHNTRTHIYHLWYKKYANKMERDDLAPTLPGQIKIIRSKYPKIFNDLSTFFALYTAITNDGIFSFLSKLKNQKRLLKFILNLNPHNASYLLNKISMAIHLEVDEHDRQQILHELAEIGKQISGFNYLNRLAQFFFHENHHYLIMKCRHAAEVLLHKIHDFLLHLPQEINSTVNLLNQSLYRHVHNYLNKKPTNHRHNENAQAIIVGEEIAALMITVFNTQGADPRPAMGYSGPLRSKFDWHMERMIKSGKVALVNQTEYLLHHSGMKIPNKSVFIHTYQEKILGEPTYQLGRFPKKKETSS